MEKLNIDCLIIIFNKLRGDNNSLYSCLLVNKEWCHLIVPILWERHIYFNCEKKKIFSNTIFSCLPTSSKQLLFDNDIKLPLTILSKSPMFNYVSFCKCLRAYVINNNFINVVFEVENSKEFINKRNLLEQEIYKLFISQCESIKKLEWRTSQPLPSFPGALTCFSQLNSLIVDLYYVNSNNLYEMAKICKNLNELYIHNYSQNVPGLISLIDAQRNLKNLTFTSSYQTNEGICEELSKALERKSYTINYLSLYNSIGVISHSFLTSLINLKVLTIYHDNESYKGIKEFQEYLANSKYPDLQSLNIYDELSCFKELAMLIEKTKGNISGVIVDTYNKSVENTGMLLKAISSHCPKIEYLNTKLGSKDLIYLKSLLMSCRNLKSLCLNNLNENCNNIGDNLLDILAKFSPKTLIDIEISGKWEYSIVAFVNFFESYRERKLHQFNIAYDAFEDYDYITTEHLNVVEEYFDKGIIENTIF
jgi:hypothetical protein